MFINFFFYSILSNIYQVEDELLEDDLTHQSSNQKSIPENPCKLPNTKFVYGECICEKGYFSNIPVDNFGCWKCSEICHSQAKCQFQETSIGKCVCQGGLIGNGVTECESPIPSIQNISPINSTDFIKVMISFSIYPQTNFFPYLALCKFSLIQSPSNFSIINGLIFPNNSISCISPYNFETNSSVSLSFNGKTWSNTFKIHLYSNKNYYQNFDKSNHILKSINHSSNISFNYSQLFCIVPIFGFLLTYIIQNELNKY